MKADSGCIVIEGGERKGRDRKDRERAAAALYTLYRPDSMCHLLTTKAQVSYSSHRTSDCQSSFRITYIRQIHLHILRILLRDGIQTAEFKQS